MNEVEKSLIIISFRSDTGESEGRMWWDQANPQILLSLAKWKERELRNYS